MSHSDKIPYRSDALYCPISITLVSWQSAATETGRSRMAVMKAELSYPGTVYQLRLRWIASKPLLIPPSQVAFQNHWLVPSSGPSSLGPLIIRINAASWPGRLKALGSYMGCRNHKFHWVIYRLHVFICAWYVFSYTSRSRPDPEAFPTDVADAR